MKKKARRISIIMPIIFVIICCYWAKVAIDSVCGKDRPNLSRTAQNLTVFEPLWSVDDIYIAFSKHAVFLVASKNNLVLYGTEGSCGTDNLIRLNTSNGEINSKTPDLNSLTWSSWKLNHTAYNSDFVYLGIDGSSSEKPRIAAYEIDSNAIVWVQSLPSVGSQISSIVTDETTIGIASGQYILLNALTGEITREIEIQLSDSSTISNRFFAVWFAAVQPQAEQSTLEYLNEEVLGFYQPPVVLEDKVVIRTGDYWLSQPERVQVFDILTTSILWESDSNVVSNVAVDGTTAFYVTSSAELTAVDLQSGQVVGQVQFTGGAAGFEGNYSYYVAANDGRVFVYFGDGRQLFAFKFLGQE